MRPGPCSRDAARAVLKRCGPAYAQAQGMRPGQCSRDAARTMLKGCGPDYAQGMRPGPCSKYTARALLKRCCPGRVQGMLPGPCSSDAARATLKGCGLGRAKGSLGMLLTNYTKFTEAGVFITEHHRSNLLGSLLSETQNSHELLNFHLFICEIQCEIQ
jgi:hypothetical protein